MQETVAVHRVLLLEVDIAEQRQGQAAVAAALCQLVAVCALADQHLPSHLGSVRQVYVCSDGNMIGLLLLGMTVALEIPDQILTAINVNYQKVTGSRDHFALQATAWLEFNPDASTVQAVFLLNSTDSHILSLHYFEFSTTHDVELRITTLRQHSSPPRLDLDINDSGLIQEAISNATNSTLVPMTYIDLGEKQDIPMQSYSSSDPLHFVLLSRDFVDNGQVYYAATFENCTGDRYHYLAMRTDSALFGVAPISRRTGVMGVLVAFFVGVGLTFAGLVCYWRKYDTLPCQKRKEDSARQVLDSNRVKSST